MLVSVALGGLFGYKADRLLVQGDTFADTASALDEFHPGRFVTAADLAPFTITLNRFDASYIPSGQQRGQPSAFDARITYTGPPGTPARTFDLDVNRPLSVGGAKVYLIGHGYAPAFRVTDVRGHVVYNQATPFIAGPSGNFLSEGVVKVPDAQPDQLGFTGVFVPTAVNVGGTLQSVFPAADNPVVSLIAYAGNLGMNSGPSQSVYQLDTNGMQRLTARPQALLPGQSLKLPGGRGTITFTGYVPWVSLAITHDPGQLPALVCGIAALAGLLLSFMIRRRRVFVRARAGEAEHHGAGRRPGPDRRQRRLRGRIRRPGRRAQVGPRAIRRDPAGRAASSTTSTRGRVRGHARQRCPGSPQQCLPDRGAGHLLPLGSRVRR